MFSSAKNYLHAFLIIAFILAGVSPACAFVSGGKNFIEICAADGSLKTIEVSDEFNPLSMQDEGNNKQSSQHKSKKYNCNFCFANSHLSKALSDSVLIKISTNNLYNIIGTDNYSYKSYINNNFQPRAPPSSFA